MTRVFFDIRLSLDGFEAASNRRPEERAMTASGFMRGLRRR